MTGKMSMVAHECNCDTPHNVVLLNASESGGNIAFADGTVKELLTSDIELFEMWFGGNDSKDVKKVQVFAQPEEFLLWCYEKGLVLSKDGVNMNIREVYALIEQHRKEERQ